MESLSNELKSIIERIRICIMEKYLAKEAVKTWQALFDKLYSSQKKCACQEWLNGIDFYGISAEFPPLINDLNKKISGPIKLTLIEPHLYGDIWFNKLTMKLYPISNEMRPFGELENATRPDAYHDLIGHIPTLINDNVAECMHEFACLWETATNQQKLLLIKAWFFTIEFGVFYQSYDNSLTVFGGGILSSAEQLRNIEIINDLICKRYSTGVHYDDFYPIIFPSGRVEKYSLHNLFKSNINKLGLPDIIFIFKNLDDMLSKFLTASKLIVKEEHILEVAV